MSFNQRHCKCMHIYMRILPRLRCFTFTITFYFTTKYECTMHYYECIDTYRSGKYISKKNLRKNGLVSLLISPWGSQTNKGTSSVGKCQSVPKDKSYQFHFLFLKKDVRFPSTHIFFIWNPILHLSTTNHPHFSR